MMDESNPHQSTVSRRGHEPDAVNARLLKLSGAGLVLLVVSGLLLVYGTTRFLARQVPSPPEQTANSQPTHTTTGLQVTAEQPQLLRELRQSEQQRLTNYEWIDEQAGIARIPIDRAMNILAKQGLSKGNRKVEGNNDNQSQ